MAGDTRNIVVPEIGNVTIRRHHWAKNLSIKITTQGEVSVSTPPRTPLKLIKLFIAHKRSWILSQLSHNQATKYSDGQIVAGTYRLVFRPLKHQSSIKTGTKNQQIIINYPGQLSPYDPSIQAKTQKAVERATRKGAEAYLPKRLAELSKQTGLYYEQYRLRNMKRKWGSCSSQKIITLNIWLITLPRELIDYVLLHELAHTRHMNHQAAFWQLMTELEPNARKLAKRARHYQF